MSDFPHEFEPFLDSAQAAILVQVHPKTLQRYARAGRVTGYRLGKLWRFRASDLVLPLKEEDEDTTENDLDHGLPHKVSSEQLSVPSHHL